MFSMNKIIFALFFVLVLIKRKNIPENHEDFAIILWKAKYTNLHMTATGDLELSVIQFVL